MNVEGLVTVASALGPQETLHKLKATLAAKGMTVFAHVDHSAGALAAGLSLRPTDLVIFGNARAGTPLMQAAQTMGIDLPLKALVWQDASGKTWLSYNDPKWLAARHGPGSQMGPEHDAALAAMSAGLAAIAQAATS
jgi:uncharacterized protein (DUF302 family)